MADGDPSPPDLTRRERDVLVALCRRCRTATSSPSPPPSGRFAQQLVVTEAAVKQHLSNLYSKFRLAGDGERRRLRLANEAIRRRAVAHRSGPPASPSAPWADELERGRDAHAHRDWPRARALLAQADAHQPLGPGPRRPRGRAPPPP